MAYGTVALDTLQSSTTGTPTVFKDGSGTEVGTLCRAWVNFNGTLTGTNAPRASFNVSSVTRNGTGDYTINFTNALPDINYAATGNGGNASGGGFDLYMPWQQTPTTTTYRVGVYNGTSTAASDCLYTQVAFFR